MCSGDLAVLLAAGWPVRRLALFSLLSALLGYVGVLTGTVLGYQWARHSPWILTLTAGVFLYVALTDMVRTDAVVETLKRQTYPYQCNVVWVLVNTVTHNLFWTLASPHLKYY